MLRALASRRVGNIPKNVSVHYVSQDVQLNETTKDMTPAQVVVDADVERKMLMEEVRELEDKAERGAYTGEDEKVSWGEGRGMTKICKDGANLVFVSKSRRNIPHRRDTPGALSC